MKGQGKSIGNKENLFFLVGIALVPFIVFVAHAFIRLLSLFLKVSGSANIEYDENCPSSPRHFIMLSFKSVKFPAVSGCLLPTYPCLY